MMYELDTGFLKNESMMCKHAIKFPINAGFNDRLELRFLSVNPKTEIHLFAGVNFEEAVELDIEAFGEVINAEVSVAFPYTLYMVIFHEKAIYDDEPETF